MNWNIVAGTWNQFRGEVRAHWGKLTDDHLDIIAGRRTELAGMIQQTYGLTMDEAELQIQCFEQIDKAGRPRHSS
ncbi:MAG TPA: CsbD family protein [Gammaproteobacteria bacterium]